MTKSLTFDHIFAGWLLNEVDTMEERDMLALARTKGFNSISEWRLSTALRLGMDTKSWSEIVIPHPSESLPKVLIGPYQGWSKFFDNQITTSFAQALEIPEFFEWCRTHNRIPNIAENFPAITNLILYRKPDGQLIHIEGGHRICAVAYARKLGRHIESQVTAAVADITDDDVDRLKEFVKHGTYKQ